MGSETETRRRKGQSADDTAVNAANSTSVKPSLNNTRRKTFNGRRNTSEHEIEETAAVLKVSPDAITLTIA